MKITPDTNVLLRPLIRDDAGQARIAEGVLASAELVVVTLPSLCELVWVLRRGYQKKAGEIASAVRALIAVPTVVVDRPAVEAGLSILERGGDFADGVIAFTGRRAGGPTFVSFDRAAVSKTESAGGEARLLEP